MLPVRTKLEKHSACLSWGAQNAYAFESPWIGWLSTVVFSMNSLSLFLNRRVTVLFTLVLFGGLASLAKSFNYHSSVVYEVEALLGGAWSLHAILAISLGFVAHWATPRHYFRNAAFRIPPLLTIILLAVIADEVLQAFIPRREFSILDLMINISGLFLGAFFHRIHLKRNGV